MKRACGSSRSSSGSRLRVEGGGRLGLSRRRSQVGANSVGESGHHLAGVSLLALVFSLALSTGCCPCRNGSGAVNSGVPRTHSCDLLPITFDHDNASTTEPGHSILSANAACILAVGRPVVLTGHTDTSGTSQYNLTKGQRMATAVKAALVEAGVPADWIRVRSAGESQPVCQEPTEECRSRCRRVECEFE